MMTEEPRIRLDPSFEWHYRKPLGPERRSPNPTAQTRLSGGRVVFLSLSLCLSGVRFNPRHKNIAEALFVAVNANPTR